ncbi:MAG: VOC family protein [Burkholderiales bacterium]|nr:VOC family protein [Burkholderiales bacterium]
MAVTGFNHYNIATGDLDRARRFYTDVIGLREGARPPFSRPGAWLYLGDQPILHISTGRAAATRRSDAFDHVAFSASDLDGTRETLRRNNVYFEEYAVPGRELHQLFLRDPDGVEIELQFSGADARAAIAAGAAVDSSRGRNT